MLQFFKNENGKTLAIEKPESGAWINIVPPLKQEEFTEIAEALDIPIDFLADSLDIDERSRYELEDNVKLIVIKTPAENNSKEPGVGSCASTSPCEKSTGRPSIAAPRTRLSMSDVC